MEETPIIAPLTYASPELQPRRWVWGFAVTSLFSPLLGFIAIWLLRHWIELHSARTIFKVVTASIFSGCLTGIVCGHLGRRAAIETDQKAAAWVSLIGLMFGVVMMTIVIGWFAKHLL